MSGMIICRITRCSSADGQALVKDGANSDTAWVERNCLVFKAHRRAVHLAVWCILVNQSKVGFFAHHFDHTGDSDCMP